MSEASTIEKSYFFLTTTLRTVQLRSDTLKPVSFKIFFQPSICTIINCMQKRLKY